MFEAAIQNIMPIVRFLAKGGILMIPIMLCSCAAVALIIERLWYYRRARCDLNAFSAQLYPLVKQRQFAQALTVCEAYRGILPRIFKIIVQQSQRPAEELEKIVSASGTREIYQLSHHLRGLAVIASITPLIGLLGTVFGMVRVFMQIAVLTGHVSPSLLAGGIWEALLTTAAGLTVAIPSLIAYYAFDGLVEKFAFQIKHESLALIELLNHD